jgi:hypothetical protein
MILPLQDVCLRCSSDFLKKSYWRGLRADLRKCGHRRLKRFLTDTFSTYSDSRRTQLQFDDMPRPLRSVLAAKRPRQVKAGGQLYIWTMWCSLSWPGHDRGILWCWLGLNTPKVLRITSLTKNNSGQSYLHILIGGSQHKILLYVPMVYIWILGVRCEVTKSDSRMLPWSKNVNLGVIRVGNAKNAVDLGLSLLGRLVEGAPSSAQPQ